MVFETFFGDELIGANNTTVPTSTIEGKTVLIYFSAHWCGPCRMFTPALAQFYKELKEKRQDFELVFASSDRDQAAFDEYFGEMPWLALPYSQRQLKEKLSKKYKVRGIPTLVVVDKDGNLITTNGRAQVAQDPQAANFPWIPPTLAESLGTTFLNQEKKEVTLDIKGKGKVIGLYFSAHWCPPCKRFTPILISKYKELKAEGKDLEIIFVSSDRDQAAFDEYFGEMPWTAVPFSDTKRRNTLGEIFEIEGIPSLIFLDGEDLSTISTNGVSAVSGNLPYPFNPPALSTLTGDTVSEINESPALVIFADPAKVDEVTALVKPIAEEFTQAKKGVIFYVAGDHPVVSSVRDFAKVSQDTPQMILLDVPGQSKYLPESKEVTPEHIRTLLNGFLQETLKGVSLRD